jgi:hypothetical protein
MSTVHVLANTRVHSVTYVTDNILMTLQDVVRLSGLSPSKISDQWSSIHEAMKAWITSEHLIRTVLEVYLPSTNELIGRWDIEIGYGWNSNDGNFWVDTDQIKTAIRKQGAWPSQCDYAILLENRPGRPAVEGWSSCSFRSTDGFVKQSLGSTVQHSGLAASASFYRSKT